MKKLTMFVLFAVAPLACRASDMTPLDVKPGLWETTINTHSDGMPAMPDDVLAKMPPEARARMEAAVKAASGPRTNRSCLTADSIRNVAFGDSSRGACKRTLIRSSASSAEYHVECTSGQMKSVADGHVEAMSSDSVKGEVVAKTTVGAGRTVNSNISFTSHWVSSDCGSVKPAK